eukprot:6060991-Pyramimonas_sp.AAC.1
MLTLRRWQVAIDEARARIVVVLPITKSGLRFHRQETVVIEDASVTQLRSRIFEQLCAAIGCQQFQFKPYSLRRGGATSFFRHTRNMPATLERGRWQDTATA